ncbi:MAG TPA: peptide chain release factor N(5)-glutamine methyltransferase [Vicinamibacterales bacterium]|nr:peptide chain release factor N(5)-glutamine methyltransferase [Vicinamibacterales bacterium]
MTIHARVVAARQRLRDAGVSSDEADLDARLLAEHLLGWTTERYFVDAGEAEPEGFADRYEAVVTRRAAREPYAYIVGHEEFWGLDFEVTRAVLIPRPETELIVEIALELLDAGANGAGRASSSGRATATVCDVGTGSGCIAVSIAHERPSAAVTAIDISASATAVARRNAERHGVASRIQFRGGDLFDGVHEQYDLIVSNPPYVPEGDRATIQAEVGRYEPGEALFAGADGLATIRRLVEKAPAHLAPGGHLVFEFGFGQSDAVADLISRARGLTMVALRRDLQEIPRVAIAKRV